MVKIVLKITPERYKKMNNFEITHGIAATKFGKCLLGLKEEIVCFLSFIDGPYPDLKELNETFPNAKLIEDDDLISKKVHELFDDANQKDTRILLKGTQFQTSVWEQLVNLEKGSTATYEDVAKALGKPKAVRAVASAIAKNNISYIVPCHRVISKSGALNKYRWGSEMKLQMLHAEKAL